MTQKLTLLTFTALFIAFMFNACSDVAGPNENLDGEVSQLSSADAEMQDFFRFMPRRIGGGEAALPNCSLNDQIISYGGANDSLEDRIADEKDIGAVEVKLEGGKVYLTVNIDDYSLWEVVKVEVYISKGNIQFTGNNSDRVINDEDPNPSSSNEYDLTLNDYNISVGDNFNLAVHVDVEPIGANEVTTEQSAWAGEKEGSSNRMYFTITNECSSNPVQGYVN